MSKFKNWRNSKRAKDERNVKAMGRRTYGYDFANDGWRPRINYHKIKKDLLSKIGRKWSEVWSELNKKYDHRTLIGKETLEHYAYLVEEKKRIFEGEFYLTNDIICFKKPEKYTYKKIQNLFKLTKFKNDWYTCKNEIWYRVQLKRVEEENYVLVMMFGFPQYYYQIYDELLGVIKGYSSSVHSLLKKHYGDSVYVVRKQQVGKTLCRKLNIINHIRD